MFMQKVTVDKLKLKGTHLSDQKIFVLCLWNYWHGIMKYDLVSHFQYYGKFYENKGLSVQSDIPILPNITF